MAYTKNFKIDMAKILLCWIAFVCALCMFCSCKNASFMSETRSTIVRSDTTHAVLVVKHPAIVEFK